MKPNQIMERATDASECPDVPERPEILLIYQTGVVQGENPGYPFELRAVFRPPEFMTVAFVCLYGGAEKIVVAGESKEKLLAWWNREGLASLSRFIGMEVVDLEAVRGNG